MKDTSFFPFWDVARGFLLAPLIPVGLFFGLMGFINVLLTARASLLGALGGALFIFAYITIACYVITTILALPLYFLGWAFFRVTLPACLFCGALIGGALSLVPFALQYAGRWPMYDSESMARTVLIANGKLTVAGIENGLFTGLASAAFGAVIASLFWWIAIRKNPPAQSRRIPGEGVQ